MNTPYFAQFLDFMSGQFFIAVVMMAAIMWVRHLRKIWAKAMEHDESDPETNTHKGFIDPYHFWHNPEQ